MSPTEVNAIIGIMVGIVVILSAMLGVLVKATVAWVSMKKDIEVIKESMKEASIRETEHHEENKGRLDRLEERVYALRH